MKYTKEWSRLDNAAKIFPPTTTKRDTKVFRFVCALYETVEPAPLQRALDRTMKQFPFYRSVLKKGLFWYYFENSGIRPVVKPETKPICRPLYRTDRLGLLFEVTYYNKRINLEIFHALSDGTGALHFLRTLVLCYLREKQEGDAKGFPFLSDPTSGEQRMQDSFNKYYSKDRGAKSKRELAYRIRGERLPAHRLGVIEARLSAKAVLAKAHQLDATLSEFLTALLICSIHDGMSVREQRRPVVVTVPVDLRKFFPSGTSRNFFGVIQVRHHFGRESGAFEDVLQGVSRSFKEQLRPETMLAKLNRNSALEHHLLLKAIPLLIKIPCLKLAAWVTEWEDTAAFSNIGRITMPNEAASQIHFFDVFLSTKRPQACLCSYGDNLCVSFSSPLVSTDMQRCFFRRLTEMGIEIEITSNLTEITETEDDAYAL